MVDTKMTWNKLVDYLRNQGFTSFRVCFNTYYTDRNIPVTEISIKASPDQAFEFRKKPILCITTKQKFQSKQLLIEDICWHFDDGYISCDEHIVEMAKKWREFCEKCEKIKCKLTGEIYTSKIYDKII